VIIGTSCLFVFCGLMLEIYSLFRKISNVAFSPACVKTQDRPPEIAFKLGNISDELGHLLIGRCRLQSQLIACNARFDGDVCCQTAIVFSHNLYPKRRSPLNKNSCILL